MAVQRYTKEFVARVQIDVAARMHAEAEYLAAITLAAAAEEIVGKPASDAGGESAPTSLPQASAALHEHLLGEPPYAKAPADRANTARSSLKHLNATVGQAVKFDPEEEAADMLDRTITNHWLHMEMLTPAMEPFECRDRAVSRGAEADGRTAEAVLRAALVASCCS